MKKKKKKRNNPTNTITGLGIFPQSKLEEMGNHPHPFPQQSIGIRRFYILQYTNLKVRTSPDSSLQIIIHIFKKSKIFKQLHLVAHTGIEIF